MVSHFDFIPFKDQIYDLVQNDADITNYGGNFELFGYETTLSLINFGDAFLAIFSFIVFMIISKVIALILKKLKRFAPVLRYFES